MVQIALVGLGAGIAAGLLFASLATGPVTAILLFYVAPLPIFIATLGWSHIAGLVAATSATAVLAIVSGAFFLPVPVISFAAWWLGYLALLARPTHDDEGKVEWYPVGRLVLWAAMLGTLVVVAAVPSFGTDQQTLQAGLRKSYGRLLRDPSLVELLVIAAPPAAAAVSTLLNVFNLWLAGRVVRISGRLTRPWPSLPALALPPQAWGLLVVALGGSFLPGLFGILSGVWAASLVMVFAILGFAVLHWVTQGMGVRTLLLACVYAGAAMLGWPLLAVALLGVAESMFNIRARIARKRTSRTLMH
ncbi:MAG TPA: DUF2232 domain-containing protein [Xanthobacteraceae bacterium]|jgi:hypothetical protein